MPLEATMIVLDDSEWMRNGDFPPTRWDAQNDATRILFDAKVGSNPESKVGLMTMAGKGPRVLASLTQEMGKIVSSLHHHTQPSGTPDILTAINIAQLALKHRQNKSQHQRIVLFIGSPIRAETSKEELVALGKKLKKNNVALDVVSFGEEEENREKLEALVGGVESGENSHLVTVSASQNQLISDVLLSSPILIDGAGPSNGGGGGGGGDGNEWGVDPNMDPELAMALRMSLEEEQARQRAAEGGGASSSSAAPLPTVSEGQEGAAAAATSSAGQPSAAAAAPAAGGATAPASHMPSGGSLVPPGADALGGAGGEEDDEDAMLQRALALSAQGEGARAEEDVEMGEGQGEGEGEGGEGDGDEDEEMTEEEAIAHAIQMSLQDANAGAGAGGKQPPGGGK